jgi:hypothetical protein
MYVCPAGREGLLAPLAAATAAARARSVTLLLCGLCVCWKWRRGSASSALNACTGRPRLPNHELGWDTAASVYDDGGISLKAGTGIGNRRGGPAARTQTCVCHSPAGSLSVLDSRGVAVCCGCLRLLLRCLHPTYLHSCVSPAHTRIGSTLRLHTNRVVAVDSGAVAPPCRCCGEHLSVITCHPHCTAVG